MKTFDIQTSTRDEAVNITDRIQLAIKDQGIADGVVTVFTPHTSCGLTITEGEDPAVTGDLLKQLDVMAPWKQPHYKHADGNSAAHVKTSLVGSSLQLIVSGGTLQLGMWQGVFLCEFDGPRIRHIWLQ